MTLHMVGDGNVMTVHTEHVLQIQIAIQKLVSQEHLLVITETHAIQHMVPATHRAALRHGVAEAGIHASRGGNKQEHVLIQINAEQPQANLMKADPVHHQLFVTMVLLNLERHATATHNHVP